ncbi:MAG: substrate-binding periplasmic protein [Kordiimonas sp.]
MFQKTEGHSLQNKLKFTAILIASILLFSFPTFRVTAQDPGETIEIIAAEIAGRLDAPPESGYTKLFNRILPAKTHYLKYQRYPLLRALRKFEQSKRVCLVPASIGTIRVLSGIDVDDLYESEAIDIVSSHFLTAPNQPKVSNFDMLKGKRVAVRQGVAIEHFTDLSSEVEIMRPPSETTAIKMLFSGRVDAIYGWIPDIRIHADLHNLPLPEYDPDFAPFRSSIHVVCKEFGGMESLMATINEQINALKASGELQEILGKHAHIAQ